ncbi:MAG: hypothetical protein LUE93_12875 [Bacteroides sp.]|nr:hypothetical protein [Bacteroides sp.]
MKKYYILWGILALLIVAACSDDDINTGTSESEPLPELPTYIVTGSRAMWVSYDPTPDLDVNATTGISAALVSWRYLKSDSVNTAFDIYKRAGTGSEQKLNTEPISNSTCWADEDINPDVDNHYRVTLTGSSETICEYTFTSSQAQTFYYAIKLSTDVPDGSILYNADDIQVGDLDGDGEMEIVVKREPYDGANQGGWNDGTTLLEAYKMDGRRLWQIDMGINIRSGSHYTSYILYDFDGDGLCEIAFRSSEGTTFADGKVITDAHGQVNDYRIRQTDGTGWASGASLETTCGLIFEGPEYISICRGYDGLEIARTENIPRGGSGSKEEQANYWIDYWGDDYGNRMDRFFIGVAYLDGIPDETTNIRTSNPSLIISRGIYNNYQVWALDLQGGELVNRWKFDTNDHAPIWLGMGAHFFRVADLNGDGRDDILYGSAAIDHNGNELWCNGNGHGDVMSVGKFVQDRSGFQIVACFEESEVYTTAGGFGCQTIDARNGETMNGHGMDGDVGRCIVADIDPENPGFEYWSSDNSGVYSCATGQLLSGTMPTGIGGGVFYNVAIYWTGEITRDLYDRGLIYNHQGCANIGGRNRVVNFNTGYGSSQGNHSTKYNPCYYGDFLGDYREEIILPSEDGTAIYIFSTNHPTNNRLHHLFEDHTYDMSQAMQNMGYNQGTNLGYYVGAETLK